MRYSRVVGFGEAMLRLSLPAGVSLEASTSMDATVGGAELNALIAARRSGMPATWVSALPNHALGHRVIRHAHASSVEVILGTPQGPGGARLGVYYLELSGPPRPQRIIYDRSGSAFSTIDPASLDWDRWLDNDSCLLLSGITPALGPNPRKAIGHALAAARRCGATVALDVNYRSTLWSRDDAAAWLRDVLPHVDVLAAGPDDLASLGIRGDEALDIAIKEFDLGVALGTSKRRAMDSVELDLYVHTPEGRLHHRVEASVVDPVGAGDALFGTFLAKLPEGAEAAAETAIGAAVSCYGLAGDALTADPWLPTDDRSIIR